MYALAADVTIFLPFTSTQKIMITYQRVCAMCVFESECACETKLHS